jgi:hypothetical protein
MGDADEGFSSEENSGAPGEIRTPGLLVRSQALYPAELRAHIGKSTAQTKPSAILSPSVPIGGEGGIRTLEGLLTLTPLAGARLRPLGHLSGPGTAPYQGARDDTRAGQAW